jgi:hypothetical protein
MRDCACVSSCIHVRCFCFCRTFETYFIPRQFLGPVENGCKTFLLSSAKRGSKPSQPSASQRSGMKVSLSVKLYDDL